MDLPMGIKSFPPGFRFNPTDEELFMFYLKRKVMGKSLGPQMMSEVDVFQFAPWELPAKACLKTRDLNWYFLCPRLKKYPNRTPIRGTEHGAWRPAGHDRVVNFKSRPVGKVKTLIYYRGKASTRGDRTDWVMREYRLEDRVLLEQGVSQDSYVICKVFEKSGLGPKKGESYGAPFYEEEWDDNLESDCGLVLHPMAEIQQPVSVDISPSLNCSVIMQEPLCTVTENLPPPIVTLQDELDKILAMLTGSDNTLLPENGVFDGLGDLGDGSSANLDLD